VEEETIQKPVRKTGKMKKIERKIANLTEKNQENPKESTVKKIAKLEKKKARLEKWLRIKLPFRFLIKLGIAWLILGLICLACTYIPILREIKSAITAAIAYAAPEEVGQVLDAVTLNFGANKQETEWLQDTLDAYLNEEIVLETKPVENTPEMKQEAEALAQEVLGTTDVKNMSMKEIASKVATNATPELVSEALDMMNLTEESKQQVEADVNRALEIIPKLNNSQMNELMGVINKQVGDKMK